MTDMRLVILKRCQDPDHLNFTKPMLCFVEWQTWSESVIKPIMFKYPDLCVELKKSHIANEGLFKYRKYLELLKVNSHCEDLYQAIARTAFEFCFKYN